MVWTRWLLIAGLLIFLPQQQGVDGGVLKVVNHGMRLFLRSLRTVTSKKIDIGPDPFCYCQSVFSSCDFFVVHSYKGLNCGIFQRFCCKTDAIEQMVHKRVNGTLFTPPWPKPPLQPHEDHIRVPQISEELAVEARKECACILMFRQCKVSLVIPWQLFNDPFECGFGYTFCCQDSFIEHILVPTVIRHTNITRGIIDDDFGNHTISPTLSQGSEEGWTLPPEDYTAATNDTHHQELEEDTTLPPEDYTATSNDTLHQESEFNTLPSEDYEAAINDTLHQELEYTTLPPSMVPFVSMIIERVLQDVQWLKNMTPVIMDDDFGNHRSPTLDQDTKGGWTQENEDYAAAFIDTFHQKQENTLLPPEDFTAAINDNLHLDLEEDTTLPPFLSTLIERLLRNIQWLINKTRDIMDDNFGNSTISLTLDQGSEGGWTLPSEDYTAATNETLHQEPQFTTLRPEDNEAAINNTPPEARRHDAAARRLRGRHQRHSPPGPGRRHDAAALRLRGRHQRHSPPGPGRRHDAAALRLRGRHQRHSPPGPGRRHDAAALPLDARLARM